MKMSCKTSSLSFCVISAVLRSRTSLSSEVIWERVLPVTWRFFYQIRLCRVIALPCENEIFSYLQDLVDPFPQDSLLALVREILHQEDIRTWLTDQDLTAVDEVF